MTVRELIAALVDLNQSDALVYVYTGTGRMGVVGLPYIDEDEHETLRVVIE